MQATIYQSFVLRLKQRVFDQVLVAIAVSCSPMLFGECHAQQVESQEVSTIVGASANDYVGGELIDDQNSDQSSVWSFTQPSSISTESRTSVRVGSYYAEANARSSSMLLSLSSGQINLSTLLFDQPPPIDSPNTFSYAWANPAARVYFDNSSNSLAEVRMAWAFPDDQGAAFTPFPFGSESKYYSTKSGSGQGFTTASSFEIALSLVGRTASASLVWSIGGPLPGLSNTDPIESETTPADNPVQAGGAYFRAPSVTGYGLDESVFFKTVEQDIESREFLAGDGLFESDGIAFSHVVLPTAVPDLGYYILQLGPSQLQLAAGSIFDFRTLYPNGVHSFALLGLGDIKFNDPKLVSDFTTGVRFYEEGVGSFRYQVISNPEPRAFAFHGGWSGPGSAVDTGKSLAKEGDGPRLLGKENMINTSRGLNGVVFNIVDLGSAQNLSVADFEFQISPQGIFNENANPPAAWASAPAPSSITVIPGSPEQVLIQWANNQIENRWLRVTALANTNTGLASPEVYYMGHLLGETNGPTDGTFTVSFADITPIRNTVGQSVDASSITDLDKNGTVSFADISAMRGNVGAQLTQIIVP